MKVRSVIFDMDGTLLNTMEMIVKCNNSVLKSEGYPERKFDEFFNFVGDGMKQCVTRALPAGTDEVVITDVLSKVLEKYKSEDVSKIKTYEGVDELLKVLVSKGIKISILTNKEHDYAVVNAQIALVDHRFEAVIGDRPHTPLKPDPAGVFEIAEITGIPLTETIFVGDMTADILTGKNAGVFAVGCLWGFGNKKDLENAGADLLIEHPLELLKII
ncbi:MAG TPA: HAD family hydrolase [bacterium]|nr:HAD family hydrolase [bacterium]